MPMELQIIRGCEFVQLGPRGEFDLDGSRAILATLARTCRRRGINRALLDLRDTRTNLTPKQLSTLIDAFREIGFTLYDRLALLHAGDRYHRARTFSL